ncbi:uncharacterized protein CIMG_13777 [Coccidioides immitis RS]|uniref:Uncharacterized protein n=1 Tax=Coccidioides immitis (strain RS) TaxID=246410 RepID=A0A0D8JWY7_COCIM|nr:uncharacterized protein CIMG_13777 [Coccidioides immitis RS]KJF61614.1 hypothetical protein CIMG_13777 [Coccidioides immitis RS]
MKYPKRGLISSSWSVPSKRDGGLEANQAKPTPAGTMEYRKGVRTAHAARVESMIGGKERHQPLSIAFMAARFRIA